MKKIVNFSALLMLLICTSAFATGNTGTEHNKVKVTPGSGTYKVKLEYCQIPTSPVSVLIYDSNNRLVGEDKITAKKAFSRTYNMQSLAEGDYTLVLKEGDNLIEKNFKLGSTAKVQISAAEKDKYLLKVIGMRQLPAYVVIVNNKNEVILEERLNSSNFERKYDLTKFAGQDVTVQVCNELKCYSTKIIHDKNETVFVTR